MLPVTRLDTQLANTSSTHIASGVILLLPKGPVDLNFQLAFPLGMRTMSKRLVPLRESSIYSDDIDKVPIG